MKKINPLIYAIQNQQRFVAKCQKRLARLNWLLKNPQAPREGFAAVRIWDTQNGISPHMCRVGWYAVLPAIFYGQRVILERAGEYQYRFRINDEAALCAEWSVVTILDETICCETQDEALFKRNLSQNPKWFRWQKKSEYCGLLRDPWQDATPDFDTTVPEPKYLWVPVDGTDEVLWQDEMSSDYAIKDHEGDLIVFQSANLGWEEGQTRTHAHSTNSTVSWDDQSKTLQFSANGGGTTNFGDEQYENWTYVARKNGITILACAYVQVGQRYEGSYPPPPQHLVDDGWDVKLKVVSGDPNWDYPDNVIARMGK